MLRYRLRLKELLKEEGIPVNRLARLLEPQGVGRSTVYGVVNGYQQPSFGLLMKIHCALEALLGREVGLEEILEVVREGGRSS